MNTKKDRLSGLIFVVLAIGICIGSVKLDLGTLRTPGPGFFSFVAGAILGLLSLGVFLRSFKGASGGERERFWPPSREAFNTLSALILLILYVTGINYVGFLIGTFLFMGIFLRIIERQRWLVVLLVSLLGTLISYAVFEVWLGISFPHGVIIE
jgi:putative tricarboxylic transport membrane protein